jgi:hypothetical protein
MVVLTVYVVRDRTAYRHQTGSRDNRQEPAVGYYQAEYLTENDSRFAANGPSVGIESNESIQRSDVQQSTSVIEADIAVAPPVAVSQNLLRPNIDRRAGIMTPA